MGIDSTHPQYAEIRPDWDQMRDTKNGSRAVKNKGTVYLPATTGQIQKGLGTGQPGKQMYDAYRCRALFPEFVDNAVTIFVGLLNNKPPVIKLPERLEGMREIATSKGESLEQLLRRIHEEQLIPGRYGLLLEAPDGRPVGEAMPFIATYVAERITNWDDGRREQGLQQLEIVVLNESEQERTSDFAWETEVKWRVLAMSNQVEGFQLDGQPAPAAGVYVAASLRDGRTDVNASDFKAPRIGGVLLTEIPFCFVNSNDIVPDTDKPPLLALSEIALTSYRGEADYRQALFAQGQDTLVVKGGDPNKKRLLGVGASIELPADGDAKFIGVDSSGLEEMRLSQANLDRAAGKLGAFLLDTDDASAESGEALKVRVAAKTPTLTSIGRTAAGALEKTLKQAAVWVGADPDEVVVEPNMDFVGKQIQPRELVELMTAKGIGAPITQEDVHNWLAQREFTKNTYEETIEVLEGEAGTELRSQDTPPEG